MPRGAATRQTGGALAEGPIKNKAPEIALRGLLLFVSRYLKLSAGGGRSLPRPGGGARPFS
ncbi:hypothetical protein C7450_11750 [Chelatococcus asaccharovorans]|uniref:Uncharacterized protein n=1 Tax=Chelatococcus asaccharovorans TaxID=28210 RepID=A0A2V3TV07_9HYPH|nr:hypothetical protein C7450_11750 [Chelatococcus asaccharovorans]